MSWQKVTDYALLEAIREMEEEAEVKRVKRIKAALYKAERIGRGSK
jgi:hypothetical protein|tara:strand:- start:1621 stop:1758 length:138 start_codon:yes stop_codon:yes gene_type:complete